MKKRRPSPDEAALWRKATRDVTPIAKSAARLVPAGATEIVGARRGRPVSKSDLMSSAARPEISGLRGRANTKPIPSPALGAGDPGRDRLVARGRLPIERTLDLHGRTQAAAEPRVHNFVETAHRDGCRCILVITGKGAPGNEGSPGRSGRGVLRQRLQEWIENPRIRPLVARISPARQRDGGSGAFYVFLKRNAL